MKTILPTTLTLLTLSLAIPSHSSAATIARTTLGSQTIEDVKIAESLTLTLDGKSTELKPIAAGLRKKKVTLFWAKVYVIQFFASTPDLKTAPLTAISLTLMRDLSATQIREGFESSLTKNGVDLESPEIKAILNAVKEMGNQKQGVTLWMAITKKSDGKETFVLEDSEGKTQTLELASGTGEKFLNIWWGTPSDSGMEDLQNQFKAKKN